MKIKTKFNVGDLVYTFRSSYVFYDDVYENTILPIKGPVKITEILIKVTEDFIDVEYVLERYGRRMDSTVFSTYEEVEQYCLNKNKNND